MSKKRVLNFILHNSPEIIALLGLLTTIVLTVINVFTRYVLNYTYAGWNDIIAIGFAWATFISCAAAYKRKMHFGVDFIVKLFPVAIQNFIDRLLLFILFVINITLLYLSIILTIKSKGKLMVSTGIPYMYYDLSAVIAFTYMTFYSIKDLLVEFKLIKSHRSEEGGVS